MLSVKLRLQARSFVTCNIGTLNFRIGISINRRKNVDVLFVETGKIESSEESFHEIFFYYLRLNLWLVFKYSVKCCGTSEWRKSIITKLLRGNCKNIRRFVFIEIMK